MKNSNSKNYKKTLIIILIFLAVSLILSFSGYAFFKNMHNNALRAEIFDGLKNSEIGFFVENKFYNSLYDKFKKNDYNISSDINLSTTMENNMFSDLDLSKFNFNYSIFKDNNKNISYHKLVAKYRENHFITIDLINEKNVVGMKSDEIVNRYVGIKKSNFQDISNKILDEEVDFSDAKKLKEYLTERENIDIEKIAEFSRWEPYIEGIKSNINDQNVVKKENVIVTLEKDQVPTTEYAISFSTEQFNSILRKFSSELEKNDEILSEFAVGKVQTDSAKKQTTNQKSTNTPVQIKAKETNYNATINIWGENDPNIQNETSEQTPVIPQENPSQQNAIVDNNSVINQVETNTAVNENVSNNTTSNNTISNENVTNAVAPNSVSNVVENQITNQVENNVVTEPIQVESSQNPAEQSQEQIQQSEVQEYTEEQENTIPQEDNFRLQGFISINENTDYVGEDNFIIGENYEETLKNISKFSKNLDWSSYILTGAKANCTKAEMKEYILNKLNERMKRSNTLVMKIYVFQNKAVKLSLEIPETNESLDIEIASKGTKEKYLNLKKLIGDDDDINGHSISIYKKVADNNNKLKLNVNTIQQNKINNKVVIDIDTIGNSNSQKYTNNISLLVLDSNGEFKINATNKIDISNKEKIEELNDDNCLFIDSLSNDELLLTADAIKDKILMVLSEKNQNFQIIDTANSNTIILSNDDE